MRQLLGLLLPLLLVSACTEGGREQHGFLITGEGRFIPNTDANHRQEVERVITASLDRALAPDWRSRATIVEMPEYRESSGFGEWAWSRATVQVALQGYGRSATPPESPEAVQEAVLKYMRPKVDRPERNLVVTVNVDPTGAVPLTASASAAPVIDDRPAPAAAAAESPPVPVPPAEAPGWSDYRIQAGDTLAGISSVFYGSPQHWRLIVAANPGLSPSALKVGQVLRIPPAPQQ